MIFTDVNTKCPSALNENEFKSILAYKSKIKGICEVLKRDRMKVVFFGRFVIFFKFWFSLL